MQGLALGNGHFKGVVLVASTTAGGCRSQPPYYRLHTLKIVVTPLHGIKYVTFLKAQLRFKAFLT